MEKKWYDIYAILTKLLVDFYEDCKRQNIHPGKKFYELCTQEPDLKKKFFAINPWAEKFETYWDVHSIDPLHIFASFNHWKISPAKRREKLNYYYQVLNQGNAFKELDLLKDSNIDVFIEFPHIQITHTVAARNDDEQAGVWNFFHKAQTAPEDLDNFDEVLNFYGVGFSSLTIFLFWIKSDYFLPLDKNTYALLSNLNENFLSIESFSEYQRLLLPQLNQSQMLYRNLAMLAINHKKSMERFKQEAAPQQISEVGDYFRYIETGTLLQSSTEDGITTLNDSLRYIDKKTLQRFSIFAIKPLPGCATHYRKTLLENHIYYLTHSYSIESDNSIIYHPENDFDLYSIEDFLNINISAIVGRNGSGKSSLTELLLLAINNIASTAYPDKFKDIKPVRNALEVELYIVLGVPHLIRFSNNGIEIFKFESDDGKIYHNKHKSHTADLNNFFYTIYTNYSIYGLNASKNNFTWLNPLFHKNDAYQTPVVIEPMRTNGNFDINSIEYLGKNRLLFKSLSTFSEDEIRTGYKLVSETKAIEELRFSLNDTKIDKIKQYISKIKDKHITKIKEHYELDQYSKTDNMKISRLKKLCLEYILYKVFAIHEIYPDIFQLDLDKDDEFNSYLQLLNEDHSHITKKLRQAVTYYRYTEDLNRIYNINSEHYFPLYEINSHIEKFMHENALSLDEVLPPAFVEPFFHFYDTKTGRHNIPFESLSSGELQSIITINSILYHLLNLNSVHLMKKTSVNRLAYRRVNIVLDEIELYHHPEMQRRFIYNLLDAIQNLEDVNELYELNIILVTHSPFILSDIISSNVLLMGDSYGEPQLQTFASNIHTLLSKSFFMQHGLSGKFAKFKIDALIEMLFRPGNLNNKELNICRNMIPQIGEPIIRKQLQQMFDSKLIEDIKQNKVERDELLSDLIDALKKDQTLKIRLMEALDNDSN